MVSKPVVRFAIRACIAACTALFVLAAPTVVGATVPPPTDTIPLTDEVPDEQGIVVDAPLVTLPNTLSAVTTIPTGCAVPPVPQMVFAGEIIKIEDATATFRVDKLLAGTPAGYITENLVDVRYGQDTKFLDVGTRYIVGAASDPFSPLLVSRVRQDSPLFGGNAVVGVNDSAAVCPNFEDPIRTLREDGETIDTGVLSPLLNNKLLIVFVLLFSVAFVVAGLFGVVLYRKSLISAQRGISRTKKKTKRR